MTLPKVAQAMLPVGLLEFSSLGTGIAQSKDNSGAKSNDAAPQKIVGCLTGYEDHYTLGASNDMLYQLDGDTETFKRYNAKMVEATGTVGESSHETSKHNVLGQQPPTLKVISLRKVADSCN